MEIRKIVCGTLFGFLGFLPLQQVQADDQIAYRDGYNRGYGYDGYNGVGLGIGIGNTGLGVGVGTYDNYGSAPYYSSGYADPYYNNYNTGYSTGYYGGPDVYIGGGNYGGYNDHYDRGGDWNSNRNWRGGSSGGGYSKGGWGGGGRR